MATWRAARGLHAGARSAPACRGGDGGGYGAQRAPYPRPARTERRDRCVWCRRGERCVHGASWRFLVGATRRAAATRRANGATRSVACGLIVAAPHAARGAGSIGAHAELGRHRVHALHGTRVLAYMGLHCVGGRCRVCVSDSRIGWARVMTYGSLHSTHATREDWCGNCRQEARYQVQRERELTPLADALTIMVRGITDVRVENTGGGVYCATGNLGGWRLDGNEDGWSLTDADGGNVAIGSWFGEDGYTLPIDEDTGALHADVCEAAALTFASAYAAMVGLDR